MNQRLNVFVKHILKQQSLTKVLHMKQIVKRKYGTQET